MSRSVSVRLRSALGSSNTNKQQGQVDTSSSGIGLADTNGASGYSSSDAAVLVKPSGRSSSRRTVNNNSSNHNNSGSNGPNIRGGLVNGNSSGHNQNNSNTNHPPSVTSTRSQSTRSSSTKAIPPPSSADSIVSMDVDSSSVVVNSKSGVQRQSAASSLEDTGSGPSITGNSSTEPSTPLMVTRNLPSSSTNYSSMNSSNRISDTLLEAVAATSAMEVDPQDESSSASSSSESSDSSDSEDSSETDPETSERNRVENHSSMHDLEKMFIFGRELLYKERLHAVETKLEEVRCGKAKEYLGPLEKLQENMRVRIEVTAKLREYRLQNLHNKVDAEELAAKQNYESEKRLLYDSIKSDLEDKIRRLEEDRNNDFTSELWLETALKRKNKKSVDIFGEKKKKPMVVSGPYIVYMLHDVDIVEDWTAIKKAMAAPKRKYVDPSGF